MCRYHREEDSTHVQVAGIDDKRQHTAILAYLMTVDFPPQVIYHGKTPRSLPYITYTPNHWANEDTSLQYLSKSTLLLIEQRGKQPKSV